MALGGGLCEGKELNCPWEGPLGKENGEWPLGDGAYAKGKGSYS